ncbi:MAG: hypothetical protein V1495_04315 [Pseudomonadota bacterium]
MRRFLFLLLLALPLPLQAQFLAVEVSGPPLKYTKGEIRRLVAQAVREIEPEMPWELADTQEWSDYMNFSHFVPLSCDGEDAKLDFAWVADENPRRALPMGEVIETGKFRFWWQYCNYYADNPGFSCLDEIHATVFHEAIHYRQKKRLGLNAIQLWGSCSHYQCREVEAYLTEIRAGTIPEEALPYGAPRLKFYVSGCENSYFKVGFKKQLTALKEILRSLPPIPTE